MFNIAPGCNPGVCFRHIMSIGSTKFPSRPSFASRGKETALKKSRIEQVKVEGEYARMEKNLRNKARSESLDVLASSAVNFDDIKREQEELIESYRSRMPFISPRLTSLVPFSRPNLIFIGGATGKGKSSISANICHGLLANGKKILVITNEELRADVVGRIAAIDVRLDYANLEDFTPEQMRKLNEAQQRITPQLNIVDQHFDDDPETVVTFEGVKRVLDGLIRKMKDTGETVSAVVIDYYQNIANSAENPNLEPWKVLQMLGKYLDFFRKSYPAPVVLFGQLKTQTGKEELQFEHRIKDGKSIFTVVTFAVEIVPNFAERTTDWICHKKRHLKPGESLTVTTKYEYGKHMDYTDPNTVIRENIENTLNRLESKS